MKYLTIVFIVLAVALLSFASVNALLPKPDLVQITGLSMYPTYKSGDITTCKSGSDYKVGDSIVYKAGEDYISHRIVAIVMSRYITKGDNNLLPDLRFVSGDNVVCALEEGNPVQV